MILMVNLTPAFAVQMEQVANEAQNYNEQSKTEMGFFKKIRFMVDGFRLIDKANNAEGNSKPPETEENIDMHLELFNQTMHTEWQKEKLLNFRNNATNTLNIHKTTQTKPKNTKNHNTIKNIQTTAPNNGNDTNQTINPVLNLPEECYTDIHNVINMLTISGFTLSQELQREISPSLQGTIVQLIDDSGNIRYAYVKELNMKEGKLTLLTDENRESTMGMDEFKTNFKGLTIKIGAGDNPEEIMVKIIQMQKDNLTREKTQADTAKTATTNQKILWGILLGVGVLLMVIGILIALYFGKLLVNQLNSIQSRYGLNYQTGLINEFGFPHKNMDASVCYEFLFRHLNGNMEYAISTMARLGVTVVALSTAEGVFNVIDQNWIKFVLCIVGTIIFVVGLGLTFVSIMSLITAFGNGYLADLSIKSIDDRNQELIKWLNRSETLNNTQSNNTNSTIINSAENFMASSNNNFKPLQSVG